ncbi:mannan endo-1,4-beta-mannosidase 7-like, partial [Andrographis paniculata]|uniref:mannan endo-1,4-beta-mannosidase 7-like n=1 Tax=Andrographis paniculata TaxID=175694 RepID=UPI0021E8217F
VFLIIVILAMNLKINLGYEFITIQEDHLMLEGIPFYANGFNAYWLMSVASDPTQRSKVSSAFVAAARHGLAITRAWAFSDGGDSPLQYSPGSYNEQMFQGLDFVVSEARKWGIRLILSLVNNYEDFGGKQRYVDWARTFHGENVSLEDEFFTNSVVKDYYKSHIHVVLNRQNNLTGIAYKDDPTIMAWELINEPRCSSDPSGATLQAWIAEMASYVKSIDSHHLLEVGLEGFYGQSDEDNSTHFQTGTDFLTNNLIPEIDFATIHSYPDQWLTNRSDEEQMSFLNEWHNNHIRDAAKVLKKPIMVAEFGKSCKDSGYSTAKRDVMFETVFSTIYLSAKEEGAAAGGLFWQLLMEGMDGLRDGYEIVFDENPSTDAVIAEQSKKLNNIRKAYVKRQLNSNRNVP